MIIPQEEKLTITSCKSRHLFHANEIPHAIHLLVNHWHIRDLSFAKLNMRFALQDLRNNGTISREQLISHAHFQYDKISQVPSSEYLSGKWEKEELEHPRVG